MRTIGNVSIARGTTAAATTDTVFRKIASVRILAVDTGFRVHDVPVVVVERSPRFQFGGFWFSVVDPCPETWSPVWYRTDDVYIDYVNDGYYMYNRQHPGIAIAVNVSL